MKKTRKSLAKKDYRKKNYGEVFTFGRRICNSMKKNGTVFTDPKVAYVDQNAHLNDAEELYNIQIHGTEQDTVNLEAAMEIVYNDLDLQADYVDLVADGDHAIVILSGFESTKVEYNYRKKDENYSNYGKGAVKSVLAADKDATGYAWQFALSIPLTEHVWEWADCTRKAQFIYTGLTSGGKYAFRHAAIVNNTLTEFSTPFEMIAT